MKLFLLIVYLFFCFPSFLYAQFEPKKIKLYLDADQTGAKTSGFSIKQGIAVALSEIDNHIHGYDIELVICDHRGNTRRSRTHLEEFLKDPEALAIFSGMHSPPVLGNRDFINGNNILMLVPWAAAGPITRYPSADNWIFRLSVDDSKAGYVISDYAVERYGIRKPALLLEKTGWGASNRKTMLKALERKGLKPATIVSFYWNLDANSARIFLRKIVDSGADAIFLVANAPEAKVIMTELAALPEEQLLPVFSHWGITGGDFTEVFTHDMRQKVPLFFIQTDFSFFSDSASPLPLKVLQEAQKLYPETIKTALDIKAPAGFIHAYDSTKILIAAIDQAGLSGDIKQDRLNIKNALESLQSPVEGLIKTYNHPFGVFAEDDTDAHEALSEEDFVMARYGSKNEIILMR